MPSSPNSERTSLGRSNGKRPANALLAALTVLVGLSITLAVYWTLARIEAQLKQQMSHSLQTVVATTREGVGIWVDSLKERISIMARRSEVTSDVQAQLNTAHEHLRGTQPLRDLQRFMSPIFAGYKYGFSVVAPDMIQIASQNDNDVGKRLPRNMDQWPIQSALKGQTGVGLSLFAGNPSLMVAAPIRDSTNQILAVLVFYLDPKQDLNVLTHVGRIGNTGETYIFDRTGNMLTTSRFQTDRTLYNRNESSGSDIRAPLTKMAESALSGNSGVDVEGYPDYRGIYVFGAWDWDRVLNVGIATEIDRSEALIPYRSIRALTLLMLAAIGGTFAVLLAGIKRRNRILSSNYAFQESIKARQETLAVVSHDLRAPLNNVLLCSNMISNTNLDPNLSRLTGMIDRSSRQMEKLISDLQDVSEMEMGRLTIEKKQFEIPDLLESIRDTFAQAARSKSIELEIAHPDKIPSLNADPDRVIQVLSNLVGNALKFTANGGKIAVRVSVCPREVRFEVQDTGPGIAEGSLSRVFEQFWKTKSSGKRGRGPGLYIAKMIVERHGGKIWVESDGQSGSTFFFTIPLEENLES
jgi:signal transduction histidine kinase